MDRKPKQHRRGRPRAAEIAAVAAIVATLVAAGTALASRAPATSPAKAQRCVNSFDPSCGPLHWEPAPGANRPTATSLTASTTRGVAGKAVSFDARATDPDASIACHWILFGDEQAGLIPALSMQRQYGRWNTPTPRAGGFATTYSHTYATPGTYHVQFGARSGDGCSNDYSPYGGESVSTVTITIAAS